MIRTYMPDRRGDIITLDRSEYSAAIREARAYLSARGYETAYSISENDIRSFLYCWQKQLNSLDLDENWWSFMYSSDLYVNHGCEWCALFLFLDDCDITSKLARKVSEARESWTIPTASKPQSPSFTAYERDGYTFAASY